MDFVTFMTGGQGMMLGESVPVLSLTGGQNARSLADRAEIDQRLENRMANKL